MMRKTKKQLENVAIRDLSLRSLPVKARISALALALAVTSVTSHAQGTVDLSGVTSAMSSVAKTCELGGALAVVIGIVFGVFQFMGRNIAQGFLSIGGGLFAGIVIGFAPQWISSLTGQSISMIVTHAVAVLV